MKQPTVRVCENFFPKTEWAAAPAVWIWDPAFHTQPSGSLLPGDAADSSSIEHLQTLSPDEQGVYCTFPAFVLVPMPTHFWLSQLQGSCGHRYILLKLSCGNEPGPKNNCDFLFYCVNTSHLCSTKDQVALFGSCSTKDQVALPVR